MIAEHITPAAYPLSAVRALALHAQALGTTPVLPASPARMLQVIEQIGCVQIDTLHLVQRSQYITLWSRLGTYPPSMLDEVAFGTGEPGRNDRHLFEYWLKEACLIPLTEYRYRLPVMRWHQEQQGAWLTRRLSQDGTRELIPAVLERIRHEGPLRSVDFEHTEKRQGSWWNWKPAKVVLEYLFNRGDLMIARRDKFQRLYDLTERVLPDWVDRREPTVDEMRRHLIARAAKSLGICSAPQAADYVRVKRTDARLHIQALLDDGTLVPVKAALLDGKAHALVVHRDNLSLLQQAADGALQPRHTTFLSPFDNLFWGRERDRQFWGFQQTLESYKPEPLRVWGYFCLPILHHDRLVGRFDPKLERKTGVLRLKKLYLEPGVAPDEQLVADTAMAMADFLAFHGATALEIEHSDPPAFGKKLLKALTRKRQPER